VENSLDSGATSIEVKIKVHGMDTVEVIDNGSGIAEEDWPSIGQSIINESTVRADGGGLKHHTSKLPALSDLPHVTTFGFRGEALSALCALCDSVTVVTATKETAPLGTIIMLGKNGKVIDSSGKVARPVCANIITGLRLCSSGYLSLN
jgi:DNA mismatch repair protein PMS2